MIQHNEPLTVFLSYARKDKELLEQLEHHLSPLEREKFVFLWSDQQVKPGSNRQQEIDKPLEKASIILLLISPNYFASDYLYDYEMRQALERHKAGTACVIPIILYPVEWELTPLGTLQALPRDGRAVTRWSHRHEAWKQIAAEVRAVVEVLWRSVVVASSLPQQGIASRLVSLLEARRIPSTLIEHTSETTGLQKTICESSAVVLVTSPEARSTHLLKEIRNLAIVYQRSVFAVWIVDTDQGEEQNSPPESWGTSISIDPASESQEVAFQELLRYLELLRHSLAFPTSVPPQNALVPFPEPRNPYKGLRAFTSDDTRDFFGRTALIDKLARSVETMLTLGRQGEQHTRLLVVIGPSGSGKSSVVMAGLLPCLCAGEVFDSKTWVYLDSIVPGEHPIESLALALSEHFPEEGLQKVCDGLRNEAARYLHLYASALAKRTKSANPQVVLVVDQFEELFTLTADEQERQQFINLLVTACTQRGGPLIVILTLRADFYDRPMQYPPLYTLIEKHQAAILPMTLDDLRAVITQPAALFPDVWLTFEENLVGDLLFDVQGQTGALPLLQFTLDQLFRRRDGRQLTRQAYQEIGGIKGALSRHAEQTYQNLPSPEHQSSACTLFLRLIDPGFTEQDTTRRRAALSEFKFVDLAQTQCMQETIEAFVQARLLTTNQRRDIMTKQSLETVEVSHEAVISEWKRLDEWLSKARKDVHFQQSLSEDVAEWKQQQKPKDRLYRGAQLKDAKAWASRNKLSEQETDFLQASIHQRTLSLVRWIVIALLLVSSIGGAGWSFTKLPPDSTLVTTLQDNVNGSLRYCIANASSGSTIHFAPYLRGTISLREPLTFPGSKHLTIQGPGADKITISGGKNPSANIQVPIDATINISGLSFEDSEMSGDAFLFNEGVLTITNSIIANNKTTAAVAISLGGGIENRVTGILVVYNTTISNNSAIGSAGSEGGGIYNEGNLTVTHSTFSSNLANGGGNMGWGGGIYNSNTGTAVVSSSLFSKNKATNKKITLSLVKNLILYNSGGGIFNYGKLTVSSSTFSKNAVSSNDSSADDGGGIFNLTTATTVVKNSTFSDNSATSDKQKGLGGGIDNAAGSLTVQGCRFLNNSAGSSSGLSFGGGIVNDRAGTMTVNTSTFSGNSSSSSSKNQGGGIDNDGHLTVTNATFSNNSASSSSSGLSFGGGIDNDQTGMVIVKNSTFSDNIANGDQYSEGGGINNAGQLTVTNSTFSNNSASSSSGLSFGGGIDNDQTGTVTVGASTFSGNSSSSSSGNSYGGGINNADQLTVTNSTFSNNLASSSSGTSYGGGIYIYKISNNQTTLSNSIIAANTASNGPDVWGALTSGSYNLLTDIIGVTGLDATNMQVPFADLKLASTLRDNGGPTQTLALLPGSPAIDKVPLQACHVAFTTDQRSNPRPDGSENVCDIGAYESSY